MTADGKAEVDYEIVAITSLPRNYGSSHGRNTTTGFVAVFPPELADLFISTQNHQKGSKMANLPFSKIRRIGNTVYLAGELGFNADGSLPDEIAPQTRNCLDRIKATLEAEGLSLANVISCTCYLANRNDFAAFNEIYASFFADPLPVRTTVESTLMVDAKLEITVIAEA